MIQRYSRKQMSSLFSEQSRFELMKTIEIKVAQAQSECDMIPPAAYEAIKDIGELSVDRIREIEAVTRHDVIAFVQHMAEKAGDFGRYVHFGLTSSDVLDTALNLQVVRAGEIFSVTIEELISTLVNRSEEFRSTLCTGRTHGMHAEPTTFGFKLLGHAFEFERAYLRFLRAINQMRKVKLSGAVGTYSSQSPKVEEKVAASLGFEVEDVATQVVPRDRIAEVMIAIALIGSAMERLCVELRHLQRSEVKEVVEGFKKGQKGSSAMPHKKNPISAENLTGCARLLRSYVQPALENVVLWHERDISHSSVERVIIPDAFILVDYAISRLNDLVANLEVDSRQMKKNIDLSKGSLFSSHLLLALVEAGHSRDEAYSEIQRLTHQFPLEHLKVAFLSQSPLRTSISPQKLEEIFSGKVHLESIDLAFERASKKLTFHPKSGGSLSTEHS